MGFGMTYLSLTSKLYQMPGQRQPALAGVASYQATPGPVRPAGGMTALDQTVEVRPGFRRSPSATWWRRRVCGTAG